MFSDTQILTSSVDLRPKQKLIRARYDAAQTTDINRRHWSMADALSADASANPQIRRTLRNRSRYEISNNCYAMGIGLTVANDVVGVGPTLQMDTGDRAANSDIEGKWLAWVKATRLPRFARLLPFGQYMSGETFTILTTSQRIDHEVKLNFGVIESELVSNQLIGSTAEYYYDGILYDDAWFPLRFDVLRRHPGDTLPFVGLPTQFDQVDSKYVFHHYDMLRPGQRRGVPEITPALELFAKLRRWTGATIGAAELAAAYAGLIKLPAGQDAEETQKQFEAMDTFEIAHNMFTVLPEGADMSQLDPKQPTTNYPDFVKAIIAEIARCLNVPYTIASLDCSEANMSAAYMEQSGYAKMINIKRSQMNEWLEWLFRAWLEEAMKIPGYIPAVKQIKHQWHWPRVSKHADPLKVANAQRVALESLSTSFAEIASEDGVDIEGRWEAQARALGITVQDLQKLMVQKLYGTNQPQAVPPGDPSNPDDQSGDQGGADNGTEDVKAQIDAYGIAVRAGVITPQTSDEDEFRKKIGLPSMSPEAKEAWKLDKGVRRPITITQPGSTAPAPAAPAEDQPQD